jgi:hypothetical protein
VSERSRIDFDRPGLGLFDHFPDGHAVEVFRGELVGRARRAVRDLAAVSQVLLDQALKVLLWFAGWLRGCHGGPSVRAVQFCSDRTRYRAERVYLVGGVA